VLPAGESVDRTTDDAVDRFTELYEGLG